MACKAELKLEYISQILCVFENLEMLYDFLEFLLAVCFFSSIRFSLRSFLAEHLGHRISLQVLGIPGS